MGTRGSWGFIVGGKRWETYVHFDSYPGGLGETLLEWARRVSSWDDVRTAVKSLVVVNDGEAPTAAQRDDMKERGFANTSVSDGRDWYSMLRNCQGDPNMTLLSGYWLDGTGFHLESLYCEWAYVFDLDARDGRGEFVVYEGFQQVPVDARVYGEQHGSQYGPVAEIARFPLERLPLALTAAPGPGESGDEADGVRRQAALVAAGTADFGASPTQAAATAVGLAMEGLQAALRALEGALVDEPTLADREAEVDAVTALAGLLQAARGTVDALTRRAAQRAVAAYSGPVGGPIDTGLPD